MMMRCIFLVCAVLFCAFECTAQEEIEVQEVINNLFKGMKNGDSSLVRSSFTQDVTLATITKDKNGSSLIHRESSIKDFLMAVATPHSESWNEMIWNVSVKIDGGFAQVWCDYAFYLGSHFSHCGVDAFHLIKTNEGWRIFHLADTRRKVDCVIPDHIQKKFK